MARIRSLKPEYWHDRKLARLCSRDARLLYIGLWNQADEWGRLNGDPAVVKGQVLPFDDVDIDGLLNELAAAGRVVRYSVDGDPYLWLPNLAKHQKLEPERVPSRLPEPPPPAETGLVQTRPNESSPRPDSRDARARAQQVAGSREQVASSREQGCTSLVSLTDLGGDLDPHRDEDESSPGDTDRPPIGPAVRAARSLAGLTADSAWSDQACQRALTAACQRRPDVPAVRVYDAFVGAAVWNGTFAPKRFPHVVDRALRELALDPELAGDHRARDGPVRSRPGSPP